MYDCHKGARIDNGERSSEGAADTGGGTAASEQRGGSTSTLPARNCVATAVPAGRHRPTRGKTDALTAGAGGIADTLEI